MAATQIAARQAKNTQSSLSYASTVNIDFNDPANVFTLDLTGNVTLTTSNLGAGKEKVIIILADSSSRTLSLPGWKALNTLPTTIAANKTAVISLYSKGSTDANVLATSITEA